ncbi:MAG: adenylate/guanylate cyclase domain-containing protein, partial [Candidatus Gastranaerophilales bacterium]|nr:adenylate/guanylate cyclase domain-containing protein [Candidatus Gastranaerophilales bacterium]
SLGFEPADEIENVNSKNRKLFETLNNITFYSNSPIYKNFLDNAGGIGVINLIPGEDTVARYTIPLYRIVSEDKILYLPSLSLAVALFGDTSQKIEFKNNSWIIGNRQIPINDGKLLVNWHGKKGTYKNISIADVILSDALEKNKIQNANLFNEIKPEFFKDKIVVIGQTSSGTDIHPTAMEMVYPGPEIIATLIDNYLNDADLTNPKRRKFITEAPFWSNVLTVMLFCTAIGYFIMRTKSIFSGIILFLLMLVFFILLSVVIFAHPSIRISINMVYPVVFAVLTAIGLYVYKFYTESQSKKVIEGLFGKFVSPQVLNKLLENPDSFSVKNQRKNMSVLFSDIRGFTTLSEAINPDELVSQLNEYLSAMVDIVLKYGGTFDKFIGDAVMAFYGDPLPMENHAKNAVLTAIEMQKKLVELNKKWAEEGKPELKIGVGINTGEMVVGYMGSEQIVDYTVIGDNVNLASRLESLTKEYKAGIIISESTYNEVYNEINAEYVDEVKVKGKNIAVKIYKVN